MCLCSSTGPCGASGDGGGKRQGSRGRMATRRMEGARIDHGAQFFTTRDPRLQQLNQKWLKEEQVSPWYDRVPGRPRYTQ